MTAALTITTDVAISITHIITAHTAIDFAGISKRTKIMVSKCPAATVGIAVESLQEREARVIKGKGVSRISSTRPLEMLIIVA